jgi:hypothetical protein
VIGSLTFYKIREIEAEADADERRLYVTPAVKGSAVEKILLYVADYYREDKLHNQIEERIKVGQRWNQFVETYSVGIIAALCPLPNSL